MNENCFENCDKMRDILLLGGEILASGEGLCAVEFDEREKRK